MSRRETTTQPRKGQPKPVAKPPRKGKPTRRNPFSRAY